jgi:hypothetical protein
MNPKDVHNENLMILFGFIIKGDPNWRKAQIKINAIYQEHEIEEKRAELLQRIKSGRIPISVKNINIIAQKEGVTSKSIINEHSQSSDLTIIGFSSRAATKDASLVIDGYPDIGNVLFVNASSPILIK